MTEPTLKPRLTAAEKEARRTLATRTGRGGRTQAGVAAFRGTRPVTVAPWVRAGRAGGEVSPAAKPVPGRPRFLADGQAGGVRPRVLKKPTAFGLRTDLWAAARVARLSSDRSGVAFPPNSLRERLGKRGYPPQRPARRPKQRNPQGIDAWLAGVPGPAKKVAAGKAHLALTDGTGLFLDPRARRSRSLVGRTPVAGGDGGPRQKGSATGAVSVSPVAQRLGFYFATDGGGYFSAEKAVASPRDPLEHPRGKVAVPWDGGPNHEGPAIREFLRESRRLRLERLPPYAPGLSPVGAAWGWLKWGRLANLAPDDLPALGAWVAGDLIELKHDPQLLRALWERSDLPFPDPPPGKQ